MQVHCDEGVAIHIGPKPCAGIREDVGEASVGERAGQPCQSIYPASQLSCRETQRIGRFIPRVFPQSRSKIGIRDRVQTCAAAAMRRLRRSSDVAPHLAEVAWRGAGRLVKRRGAG